jgi:hypothetical protein
MGADTGRNVACLFGALASVASVAAAGSAQDYNVVWNSPSKDAGGSMPLGNGDIGLNAWVEENGDLVFYLSKTDSWDDNGRLLKVGKVRVRCEPPLVAPGCQFRQELGLPTATLRVLSKPPTGELRLALWVDAGDPAVHLTVDSANDVTVTASIELWRTERYELPSLETSDVMLDRSKPGGQHEPTIVEPDTILTGLDGRIGWYHHNAKSVGPAITAKIQGVDGFEREDPLLHRAFGAVLLADRGERLDDEHLQSPAAKSHRFSLYVLTQHPATPEQWLSSLDVIIAAAEKRPFAERLRAHEAWWQAFWDRSWLRVSVNQPTAPQGMIPASGHPVRIGLDQSGGNAFRGEMGRVSVCRVAPPDDALRELSRADREKPSDKQEGVLYSGVPQSGVSLDGSTEWTFPGGMLLEAWVKPEQLPPGGGRIIDRITPGGSDGFLLDTYPGNSLRLIVGESQLTKENALPAGQWTHVVAVVDPGSGAVKLFVNGEMVASQTTDTSDEGLAVSRGYALQRFVNACAGRGRYPIKFNGSIFTVPYPGAPGDGDYRRWGPGYWWQNTRLPYLSMCASGDYELMQPLFRMYAEELLPLFKYRTKLYLGHEGAYIPECLYFWGDMFSETYGWQPCEEREDKLQASGWHKWEWVSGPELAFMLLDYYEHTQDEAFLRERLLPLAGEILTFFDQHYQTGEDGRLVMHPAQALETWWECTNPMPEVAGLHAVLDRLLALPKALATDEQRAAWRALKAKLPALPTREADGVQMLAPATQFAQKNNIENPELYAVFPFRLCSFDKPNAELGIQALKHRTDKGNFGWRQDDVFMAYLGLAEEAREYVVGRARRKDANSRFPAFWGPNYDWVPDQDHGGILMKALQAMLLQTDGRTLYLLPAWPAEWDAEFKLRAPYRTTVEGEVKGGKLTRLVVTPESRRGEVVVCKQ